MKSAVKEAPSALFAAWQRTVRRDRDRIAVIEAESGRRATFGELDARAAAWLARHGPIPPGAPIVFAAANGIRWLEIFVALVRAGAVAVPLDPGEPAEAQRASAQAMRAAGWFDGERLQTLSRRHFRDPEIALVKLTSGSTGRPRALPFTGAQLLADARQLMATMRFGRKDLNYGLIPFGHSYGLGNLTIPLLASGVPVVAGALPLPHAIAADFERWRPSVFPGVPAMWRALASSDVPASSLRSLRLAISAGAALAPEVARAFAERFGHPIHNFYGSSETGGIAYDRTGRATRDGGVGRAVRGVTVRALDRGRIAISSPAVFTTGNRQRRQRLGAWTPGDRVAVDAAGQLTILGRSGATVKVGGRRVNLGEVEARLRRLAGVREVWVGASAGPSPVIGAALASERPAGELRVEASRDTAAWKLPKKWLVLAALPLTARGKVDTAVLRDRLQL